MKLADLSPALVLLALFIGVPTGAQKENRDLVFEAKSAHWMQEYKNYDDALKAGQFDQAERIVRSIIADRINYNLDLSRERSSLAHVYEQSGKDSEAEALYKINIKTREGQDGEKGYTVIYPLNEYADFLEKKGRGSEAKTLRERAQAIETAANEAEEACLAAEKAKTKASLRKSRKK